jgi:hypothetical protein
MRKIGAENRIELSMRALHGSYKQSSSPNHYQIAEPATV